MDLTAAFESMRRAGRKALIPFVMAGDPDLRTTRALLPALEEAGADVIEVGIPFSDPLADGPVIQAASSRALARGATPPRVLDAIASVRGTLRVPVVALTYWNPVLAFSRQGVPQAAGAFAQAARRAGLSGVIVPDLPVEESRVLREAATRAGLAAVLLAAPTSPPERLRRIARAAQGFIYYVSVTGTTGARRELPPSLTNGVRQLKLLTTKPVCVGFGISTPAHAAAVARVADGVIVGSALVRDIASGGRAGAVRRAAAFVSRLRRAVR
jgi:tryptophan synthase alpha chain